MAETSTIEWTDATWQPITGCSVVSPGCTNCYAMGLAGTRLRNHPSRVGLTRPSKAGPVWTGEVRLNEAWLMEPLRWRRPRKIFVCAHGDLFHEAVPDEWIDRVFAVMALCPQHTFQVLTKRAARMRAYLTAAHRPGQFTTILDDGKAIDTPGAHVRTHSVICDLLPMAPAQALNDACAWQDRHHPDGDGFLRVWPLLNVWLGVSTEDQRRADERIPDLRATPAAIRFVSTEPLLGSIDFTRIACPNGCRPPDYCNRCQPDGEIPTGAFDALAGGDLDWMIVGGESGPGARPMHPNWARSIRDQCAAVGVAFHFKQWGEWADAESLSSETLEHYDALGRTADGVVRLGKREAGRLLDGRTWDEMPEGRS